LELCGRPRRWNVDRAVRVAVLMTLDGVRARHTGRVVPRENLTVVGMDQGSKRATETVADEVDIPRHAGINCNGSPRELRSGGAIGIDRDNRVDPRANQPVARTRSPGEC
jgi:hypothetical protein